MRLSQARVIAINERVVRYTHFSVLAVLVLVVGLAQAEVRVDSEVAYGLLLNQCQGLKPVERVLTQRPQPSEHRKVIPAKPCRRYSLSGAPLPLL